MPRYFTNANYFTNSKNRLTDEFQQLLKEISNRILESDEDFWKLRTELVSQVANLNRKHPKCKPIQPEWWSGSIGNNDFSPTEGNGRWTYGLYNGCNITVYLAKN